MWTQYTLNPLSSSTTLCSPPPSINFWSKTAFVWCSQRFDTRNEQRLHTAYITALPDHTTRRTTPAPDPHQVIRSDGVYQSQQRFGLYRWHITDPIRFEKDLRVTIQALGWRTEKNDRRYLPLQDDIASVAFWYQTLPTSPFPSMADRDYLEII